MILLSYIFIYLTPVILLMTDNDSTNYTVSIVCWSWIVAVYISTIIAIIATLYINFIEKYKNGNYSLYNKKRR